MNSEFGFVVQPLSVFNAMNIESGCALQPKCRFNNVNIEFGCPAVWEGEHVWLPAQLSGGGVVDADDRPRPVRRLGVQLLRRGRARVASACWCREPSYRR
ncbi:MAG: hypothetical protein EXR71_10500 [Myxococcales bacterium]|nr:hypothetical protein [Myxococcales bacterium]